MRLPCQLSTKQETSKMEPQFYSFRAKARIISEIGDELISSDAIALYELIKNAYDAGSEYALIEVMTPALVITIDETLKLAENLWAGLLSDEIIETKIFEQLPSFESDLESREILKNTLKKRDLEVFKAVLEREFCRLSTIRIVDEGHGMSRQVLEEAFLAIGTPMRRQQRSNKSGSRATLGEKGIGRFSTKRLGNFLKVKTTANSEKESLLVNHLKIDWRQYAPESDLFLEEVTNPLWSEPTSTVQKSGTELIISDLNIIWSLDKLKKVAEDQLSKLINPFFTNDFRIIIRYNKESIDLQELQEDILRYARSHIIGEVNPSNHPCLQYTLTFNGQQKQPLFKPEDRHLPSADLLAKVGSFRFELYEFDRNDREIPRAGAGRKSIAGKFLDRWGGGFMLFRDGFRVMPYGGPSNDWLEIDKRFFRERGGTRLRTVATTGYIAITSERNPLLIDQTNREGLRENEAYILFNKTLQEIISLLNKDLQDCTETTKQEQKVKLKDLEVNTEDLEVVVNRIDLFLREEQTLLSELRSTVHGNEEITLVLHRADELIEQISEESKNYRKVSQNIHKSLSIEVTRSQRFLELAGLGLTAEHISHELNSLLDRSRGFIDRLSKNIKSPSEQALIGQLIANLQSLRRVSSFLEPLTNASRQRRVDLCVLDELNTIVMHYPDLDNGLIKYQITNVPRDSSLCIKTSRGLLLQVFDNLISNSIYWLKKSRIVEARINIYIDSGGVIIFEDNGSGIDPDLSEKVFEPFVTTKPDEDKGRGLGLFIVKELLDLEDCNICLLDEKNSRGRLYRFQMDLSNLAK
jgi:signal transduction histidine kinase